MLKSRRFIVAVCVLVVLVIGLIGSVALLNSDWLKGKLEAAAKQSLNADLSLASIKFNPFTGTAEISGITLARKDAQSDLQVKVDDARIDVSVLALFVRSLNIQNMELNQPEIIYTIQRPPQKESKGTADKLKNLFNKAANTNPQPTTKKKKQVDWKVGRMAIFNGHLEYTAKREGSEPLELKADRINYIATDVTMHSMVRLLYGCDAKADVTMGGPISFDKKGSTTPATGDIKGIDLKYMDRYFDQSDALVVDGGLMDVNYSVDVNNLINYTVKIDSFKLSSNPEAEKQEFMFIPVERIVDRVDDQDGSLELSFQLGPQAVVSDDLEYLAGEFWTGLWIAIIEEISPDSVKEISERGKTEAMKLLKGLGKKK